MASNAAAASAGTVWRVIRRASSSPGPGPSTWPSSSSVSNAGIGTRAAVRRATASASRARAVATAEPASGGPQLTLTASQLLVSVSAIDPAGSAAPASPCYRVGKAGVPVPNAEPGEH